jgi:hypothetical protein
VVQRIVALRKRNFSITDIKSVLDAEQCCVSLDTIDRILKSEGFAPLPKRTRQQRLVALPPEKLPAPASESLSIAEEQFLTDLFFQLNHPSSSIVVKVDFDLTLSLLAHNLYRRLAQHLPGFEQCTADTINRKFLQNGATVSIEGNTATVHLKKKTHLPILFELPWMKQTTSLSWMNLNIRFTAGTTS